MDFFVSGIRRVSQLCGIVAAALIALGVLVVCQMVFVRYVLNHNTIWQTDFVTWSLVAATFVGSPYLLLSRGHVNVDVLPLHLTLRKRWWLWTAGVTGPATVLPGQTITYAINVSNSGRGPALLTALTDTLPNGTGVSFSLGAVVVGPARRRLTTGRSRAGGVGPVARGRHAVACRRDPGGHETGPLGRPLSPAPVDHVW